MGTQIASADTHDVAAEISYASRCHDSRGGQGIGNAFITIRDDHAVSMRFVVLPRTDIRRKERRAELDELPRENIANFSANFSAVREADKMVASRVLRHRRSSWVAEVGKTFCERH